MAELLTFTWLGFWGLCCLLQLRVRAGEFAVVAHAALHCL